MTLYLHHVFVCTSVGAPEAEELLDAGLFEGSPNIHPGQGTANRRFFFKSGFLELLWVHDECEAQSTLTAPTKLWERWSGRGKVTNPFGLCFACPQGIDSIPPFPSWAYRPDYLPKERSIVFADKLPLSEPEVFVLSWPQVMTSRDAEPISHPLGLYEMHSVSVGLPDPTAISDTLCAIRDAGLVKIHRSAAPELVIRFTSQQGLQLAVPALGLSIVGQPDSAA